MKISQDQHFFPEKRHVYLSLSQKKRNRASFLSDFISSIPKVFVAFVVVIGSFEWQRQEENVFLFAEAAENEEDGREISDEESAKWLTLAPQTQADILNGHVEKFRDGCFSQRSGHSA